MPCHMSGFAGHVWSLKPIGGDDSIRKGERARCASRIWREGASEQVSE